MILTPTEEYFEKLYKHRGHTVVIVQGVPYNEIYCAECSQTVLGPQDFNANYWVDEASKIMGYHVRCEAEAEKIAEMFGEEVSWLSVSVWGENDCATMEDAVDVAITCDVCCTVLFDADRMYEEE